MRLMMPFARRVAAGYADATGGSTSTIVDTVNLKQPTNFWAGQWAFRPASGEVRRIIQSATASSLVSMEYPFAATVAAGDDYEIHSVFNAIEIHQAINDAISTSYPAFFESVENKSLVICEDKLEYDLTSIVPSVGIIHEVAIERPTTRIQGTVVSTAYDAGTDILTITLESTADLSLVDSDWYFSLYKGAGEGVAYAVLTVNNTLKTITVSVAADPGLGVTSKYQLWDARAQVLDWYRIKQVHFSSKEWPSALRFYSPNYSFRGSRVRIKYSTLPSALATETATTTVPSEYIINKAVAILAQTRLGDNRVDRQRYAIMQETFDKEAEMFKERNFFRLPDSELWMEGTDRHTLGENDPNGNPMGWR
jgi:hypothetical protein